MEGLEKVINAYFSGMADILGFMTADGTGAMIVTVPLGMIALMLYSMPLLFAGAGVVGGIQWIVNEIRH